MLNTVFPHIVSAETIIFFEFGNPNVTVHNANGHNTQMCGNYSREVWEETIQGWKL